jgi:hypothetical protein
MIQNDSISRRFLVQEDKKLHGAKSDEYNQCSNASIFCWPKFTMTKVFVGRCIGSLLGQPKIVFYYPAICIPKQILLIMLISVDKIYKMGRYLTQLVSVHSCSVETSAKIYPLLHNGIVKSLPCFPFIGMWQSVLL